MPTIFTKPVAEFSVSVLAFVINSYIKGSNCPDAWKAVRINPIQKISQTMKLKDYRIVSIFQFCRKFMENVF